MPLHPHPALVRAFGHEWGNSERVYPALLEYNQAYLAHAADAGSLPRESIQPLLAVLAELGEEGFGAIDYHAELDGLQPNIERAVRQRAGSDVSDWLSTGRARQECELVARHIIERDLLLDVAGKAHQLAAETLSLARLHVDAVMPWHTWAQQAEPVTFGYYLAATAHGMLDDLARMGREFASLDRSRAGIGQVVPPPTPIDRGRLGRCLGFAATLPNSLHAYGSLDIELGVLSSLTVFTANLARFAETLFLLASTEFGFLRFADAFTGTSYAMPHKRNPYALRLVRPAASRVAGVLSESTQLFSGGLQVIGNGVIHVPNRTIHALDMVGDVVDVLVHAMPTIEVDAARMRAALAGGMSEAPALLFHLVEHHGLRYRQAHELCAAITTEALDAGTGLGDLPSARLAKALARASASSGTASVTMDAAELSRVLDHGTIVTTRGNGGPDPVSVQQELARMHDVLAKEARWIEQARARRQAGRAMLEGDIQRLCA